MQKLLEIINEICDLKSVAALLEWDQETYMPKKAAKGRGKQLSLITSLAHQKLTDEKNAYVIKSVEEELQLNPESFTLQDRALIKLFKREYDKAVKLPNTFVVELSEHQSKSLESWREARQKSDFSIFQADLEKMVDLKIQEASLRGYKDSPYDALLDLYEPNLTEKTVIEIFEPLKKFTSEFLKKILASAVAIDTSILSRDYEFDKQWAFGNELIKGIGYDTDAGRLDLSTHPFTTELGTPNDVRITSRVNPQNIAQQIMGCIHETGHALYEQGISQALDRTFLSTGTSLGIHESQSRMWENVIGRSPQFWDYWFPKLIKYFPDKLNISEKEAFVMALNKVTPSYIRTEADEVTYNLHIILRFDIERALLKKEIKVADLPKVWEAKYKALFNIDGPPSDALGVLQDIHWASGAFGYFPTYSLGNLYAAQFWNSIVSRIPDVEQVVSQGKTEVILKWLRNNIHVHGSVYSADELCQQVTGASLNSKYLVEYLTLKYSNLYKI